MKLFVLFVLCVSWTRVMGQDEVDYTEDVTDTCCTHGAEAAPPLSSAGECGGLSLPDYIEPDQEAACRTSGARCCRDHFKQKDDCAAGTKYAAGKRCSVPSTDIGKTCCEECTFGALTGESQGAEACGGPPEAGVSPSSYLRKSTYYKCCVEAATKMTTTEAPTTPAVRRCAPGSCRTDQECDDSDGTIRCLCRVGYRRQPDGSCKDINECAESTDNLCTQEDHVCHNLPGSYKCVPLKKRDVPGCPPGFKKNVINQVCDDINECQLPRPPCAKYLCENTIGGYKCAGKPGTPAVEGATEAAVAAPASRNDICPKGFRAGANDECIDIDECEEHLDDCQRLSQHCINTHGDFFCQDHVSKRCAPGFKVNSATGICEDIDECEESSEVCKRNQVCVNLPGAYDCKSKISTLPKLTTKTCQEGTRMRVGSKQCEDIDECREGTHLCDQFQYCINTFGGHECRCKAGFELDSTSGSCEDIDECAMKLDNCPPGQHCLNVLGSFTCTRRAPTSSTTSTTVSPAPTYEYEYYDTDDEGPTNDTRNPVPPGAPGNLPSTLKPNPPPPPKPTSTSTTTSTTTTTTTTTPRPNTTSTTIPKPTTTNTTTQGTRIPYKPGPNQYNPYGRPTVSPYTNRPRPNQTTPPYPPAVSRPTDREGPRRPENRLPNVNIPPPNNPEVIEKERNPDGGYDLNTAELPKDKWTNVIAKDEDKDGADVFDPNEVHCLDGYEKNVEGECIDIDECASRHICSALETCKNEPGRYRCECVSGFRRDPSGYCAVIPTATTSATTTSTTMSTTTSTTTVAPTRPEWMHPPPPVSWSMQSSPRQRPRFCEMGYVFDSRQGQCVDIDECATGRHTCVSNERCINVDGGFQCEKAPNTYGSPAPGPAPRPARPRAGAGGRAPAVLTVGAQYGQRGPRSRRPTYTRTRDGLTMTSCQKGYRLIPDKNMCLDIDECAVNISECGPQQRCENFFGGHSCQCPAGHQLKGSTECEDIDECLYGTPCSYTSQCINTVGSYRCQCNDGFRNARSNDKVCMDIDECTETPGICQQGCANAWGSYRCYCHQGYRMQDDGKTCVDVDECAEFAASATSHSRARLCGGECVNEPGSYRCSCPAGYRLSEDRRSCIDIDECETGEASCARSSDPSQVCQNTRGGYHCHTITCPAGYQLEAKHRCTRIQRTCSMSDWRCMRLPSSYSYNFITFVANIYLPLGRVDLFTMHGPAWSDSYMSFEMRLVDVQAAPGVQPASLSCFDARPTANMCVVSLLCALEGPQVAELELTMSLYQHRQFAGSAVARLVVIVSQYEF